MKHITSFHDDYAFLGNFFRTPIRYSSLDYPSLEHAYQAAKTLDLEARRPFTNPNVRPGTAKHWGRVLECRPDWEEVKEEVMLTLLRKKFAPGSQLARRLLLTGDAILVEGNHHGDIYWGVCRGKGKNRLGVLLMQVRTELQLQESA